MVKQRTELAHSPSKLWKDTPACPNCGETEINSLSCFEDADGRFILYECDCPVCGSTWEDIYLLMGYRNLEVGNG